MKDRSAPETGGDCDVRLCGGMPADERGFVLITALWLLLLCAAIVSLMMLRSAGRAETIKEGSKLVQAKFDVQAAVDTVAADLLMQGGRSQWARLPAQGIIRIDGRDVTIEASSENGRLDLNDGDLAIIDRALQGLGIASPQRTAFHQSLDSFRAAQGRMTSIADARPLLATLDEGAGGSCIDSWFTLYSGLSQPSETQMSGEMAKALALPIGEGTGAMPMRSGEAIRLYIRASNGYTLLAIIRVVGIQATGYHILRWSDDFTCS